MKYKMAAPMRSRLWPWVYRNIRSPSSSAYRNYFNTKIPTKTDLISHRGLKIAAVATFVSAYIAYKKITKDTHFILQNFRLPLVNAAEKEPESDEHLSKTKLVEQINQAGQPWHHFNPPTKKMRFGENRAGLKLTLYQYVTCPFCCKVRAYLDYYGVDYDVVEVDSIRRTQKKWTSYKKVPILVVDGNSSEGSDFLQINDSSVIVSLIHSFFVTGMKTATSKLLSYYPCIENKEGKKMTYDFPNKYFIMYGDVQPDKDVAELREEREWRAWVDDNLVHILSPNAYRTLPEAVQSFKWFSEAGDWENCMSSWSRLVCIYSGALVMWAIGGRLRRKYGLDKDVRQSLYKAADDWMAGIGSSRTFMGGDQPNLADLAVYGVLCSIEGCEAFKDMCQNTNIMKWYKPMKEAVQSHAGKTSQSQSYAITDLPSATRSSAVA